MNDYKPGDIARIRLRDGETFRAMCYTKHGSNQLCWQLTDGRSYVLTSSYIATVLPVALPPETTLPDFDLSWLQDLAYREVRRMLGKQAKATAPVKFDLWSTVTDAVTTLIAEQKQAEPEPPPKKSHIAEPTEPGTTIFDLNGTAWMRLFDGTFTNKDGTKVSWSQIEDVMPYAED